MLRVLLGSYKRLSLALLVLVLGVVLYIFFARVDGKLSIKDFKLQENLSPLCSHHSYSSVCYNKKIQKLISLMSQLQKNMTWSRFQVKHKHHSDFWIGNYKVKGSQTFFKWGCLHSLTTNVDERCARKVFTHDYIEKLTKPVPGDDHFFKSGDSICSVSQRQRKYCSHHKSQKCNSDDIIRSIDYFITCKKIRGKHVIRAYKKT